MQKSRKLALLAATAATALALSGCAGGTTGTDADGSEPAASDTAAAFNRADVTFAQLMIPHHEQAVEMSDLLLAEDGVDEQVRDLATQIKEAQQPEIDQMREWLDAWGEEESDMGGMNHGSGMMSDADMMALEDATGGDAARLFLEQMIVHHEGAIAMAEAEVQDGENADAKAMAEAIITTQTEEITTMQELLASL